MYGVVVVSKVKSEEREFQRKSFLFCLIKKETKKSLPENSKLKNYRKTLFRSPSRSPFRLNSRTAATSFYRCFLAFLI
jgi:hypothetical protein